MKKVLTLFVIWLLVVNLFGLVVLNRLNLKVDTAYTWINERDFYQAQSWNLVSLHDHWDSPWYLDIASHGYSYQGQGKLSNIVFFPLYPLLMKIVSFLTWNYVAAGWIVSSLFLLLALYYFYKLLERFHQNTDPYLPILFLLIFPTAFFLNAVYTESLFLFLSLGCFYHLLDRKYLWAGVFGMLAALTRLTGVLLFIPIVWEYLEYRNHNFKSLLNRDFLPLLLVPTGLFGFFLFHQLRFGKFWLFFIVESWWGRSFQINWDHFQLFSNPSVVNLSLDLLFVAFTIVVTFLVFKRVRVSYGLYMLATILIALSSGTLMSIGRYILVLFPVYILAASIKNQTISFTWVFISALLLALNITLFVNSYWAG